MPCSRHSSATGTPPSACRRIAMICASVYLIVFIRNLLVHLAEKFLLVQPLTFGGGDYQRLDVRQAIAASPDDLLSQGKQRAVYGHVQHGGVIAGSAPEGFPFVGKFAT